MNITKGKIRSALKVVVYGQEGIGKSTFASEFPDPVFIDTEGSTKQLDVARFDPPTSWEMLLSQVDYIRQNPSGFRTLVIDTADWAEKLCIKAICDKAQKDGIEDFGWGKGYTYVQEEFGRLLNKLSEVVSAGINVVVTAHAQMRKVEQPDEMGSYDRWELKLTKQCSPLLKEWTDLLLFANYKTIVVKTDNKKYKGQGGQQRIMYTTHTASWDAKNRFSLPDVLPFDYEQIAPVLGLDTVQRRTDDLPQSTPIPKRDNYSPIPENNSHDIQNVPNSSKETKAEQTENAGTAQQPDILDMIIDDFKANGIPVEVTNETNIPDYVPKALADLMRSKQLTVRDIQRIVAARGYFPENTPFENYPPDFVDGCLIAAFPQLYDFAVKEGLVDLPL